MSPPYRRGPVYKSRSEVREADKEVTLVRTLAITQNITVDGSIEMLGDWFDPQGRAGVDSSDLLAELRRQSDQTEALLLGRQTFEDFRGYWPKQTDDATGIADSLNRVQKYVVSSTMTELEWQNSSVLSGDPVQNALSLKQQPGGDIVVTGSIRLCHALIGAGLVDEYRLFVYPVVQGRGRRLFPDGLEIPKLRLVEGTGFRSGVTYSRYAQP
jgi:dihydrofolate reductase